ncbi:MAG TPA: hypothetical protein VGG74_25255 [Kofleriaceae bacterium]|jgi:hypothetical protein
MKRVAILCALVLAACNKPTPDDCEKALRNMQALLGTENLNTTASLQGEVRRCRGGSTKEAVACAIKATSIADLDKCDFEKTGRHKLDVPEPGSAGSAVGSGT